MIKLDKYILEIHWIKKSISITYFNIESSIYCPELCDYVVKGDIYMVRFLK